MSSLVTSPAQANDPIRAIDDEIEALRRKARDLLSKRNTLVPIGCLPAELLAEIFFELVLLHDSTTRPNRGHGHDLSTQRWLVVTFVCRAWRDLALGTPHLWSYVLFNTNHERVRAFLTRSRNAPLVAVAWSALDTHWPIQALFSVIRRAQELRLSEAMFHALVALAEYRPRELDSPTLHILNVTSTRPFPPTDLVSILAAASWPTLSDLELYGGNLSVLRALMRPTLTSLSVGDMSREARIDVATWIAILQKLPYLEFLSLRGAIISQFERPQHELSAKADLPRLLVLKLWHEGTGIHYAYLLRHLTIPADTLLHFEQGRGPSEEDSEFIMGAIADQILSAPNIQSGRHGPIRAIEIGDWGTHETSIRAFPDPLAVRRTTRRDIFGVDKRIPCHHIVLTTDTMFTSDEAVQSFPFSSFSEVHILSTWRAHIKSCETWRVLSQLSSVREVYVSYKPLALMAFLEFMLSGDAFHHLERLVIGDDRDELDEDGEPKHPQDVYVSSRLVEMLGDVLRARHGRGLGVKRLALGFHVDDDDNGKAGSSGPSPVSSLRAWVEELIYWDDESD